MCTLSLHKVECTWNELTWNGDWLYQWSHGRGIEGLDLVAVISDVVLAPRSFAAVNPSRICRTVHAIVHLPACLIHPLKRPCTSSVLRGANSNLTVERDQLKRRMCLLSLEKRTVGIL